MPFCGESAKPRGLAGWGSSPGRGRVGRAETEADAFLAGGRNVRVESGGLRPSAGVILEYADTHTTSKVSIDAFKKVLDDR